MVELRDPLRIILLLTGLLVGRPVREFLRVSRSDGMGLDGAIQPVSQSFGQQRRWWRGSKNERTAIRVQFDFFG